MNNKEIKMLTLTKLIQNIKSEYFTVFSLKYRNLLQQLSTYWFDVDQKDWEILNL